MVKTKLFAALAFVCGAVLLSGCGRTYIYRHNPAVSIVPKMDTLRGHASQQVNSNGRITLEEAYALALNNSPRLESAQWEVVVAGARASQAGRAANPEIAVELEDFAGSATYHGTGNSQLTVGLSQNIGLGGEANAREEAALFVKDIREVEITILINGIKAEVHSAYFGLANAVEHERQSTERLRLSNRVVEVVTEQANAGRISKIEADRARVLAARAKLDQSDAIREITVNRLKLAALLGIDPMIVLVLDSASVAGLRPPQTLGSYVARMSEASGRIYDLELNRRKALVDIAYALAIPDPTISAGYRTFGLGNTESFVASLSIPIPIFDANGGAIEAAQASVSQLESQKTKHLRRTQLQIASTHAVSVQHFENYTFLRNEVVPNARAVAEATLEGYTAGKFNLMQVLDAQRAFQETEMLLTRSQSDYFDALGDLEYLSAGTVPDLSN